MFNDIVDGDFKDQSFHNFDGATFFSAVSEVGRDNDSSGATFTEQAEAFAEAGDEAGNGSLSRSIAHSAVKFIAVEVFTYVGHFNDVFFSDFSTFAGVVDFVSNAAFGFLITFSEASADVFFAEGDIFLGFGSFASSGFGFSFGNSANFVEDSIEVGAKFHSLLLREGVGVVDIGESFDELTSIDGDTEVFVHKDAVHLQTLLNAVEESDVGSVGSENEFEAFDEFFFVEVFDLVLSHHGFVAVELVDRLSGLHLAESGSERVAKGDFFGGVVGVINFFVATRRGEQ